MSKNFEEIIIYIVQLLVFYAFPMLAVPNNNYAGIIVIIILATFMLSLGIGGISKKKIKYYYPIILAFLFIPVVYIYNNEFTLLDCLWCFLSSFVGVVMGHIIMHP